MLTGFRMLSLACKCIFYKPEHTLRGNPLELNFEGLEIKKENIPTDRALRDDEKNGFICLVIMFTPRIKVIKMSKLAHFLEFLLIKAKIQSIWAKYLSACERSRLASSRKCYILNYQ